MTRFSATTESTAVVPADRQRIWEALTDPDVLPTLTPNLNSIDADGTTWVWNMTQIPILSTAIRPAFTEQMSFTEPERIEFTHTPPDGSKERAGAEGWYRLEEVEGGTALAISLTVCVDLPLPKLSSGAVTGVMKRVMDRMGDKFAVNLLDHLDKQKN